MRKPNSKCSVCSAPIYRRPIQIESGPVFCSQICCGKSQRIDKNCPVCSKEIPGWKSRKTCSRACSNKNRTGITYDKPQGRQPKADARDLRAIKEQLIKERGPFCERCKYDKVEILNAHHIIERCYGGTNAKENLELLCPNCHTEEHLERRNHRLAT